MSRATYGHGDCREVPGESDRWNDDDAPFHFAAYRVLPTAARVRCLDGRLGRVEFSHPALVASVVLLDDGKRQRFRSTELCEV